jgi:DNA-binding NarL/FixJ family response regulator
MLCAGDCFVKRVRVLVANHPRLMRELVTATIADQPDIEVVGEVQDESDLADTVEQVLPDVLIIAMDETESSTTTLARVEMICSNMSGPYDPAPTTWMSSFFAKMRNKASRSSRFSAIRKTPATGPENPETTVPIR